MRSLRACAICAAVALGLAIWGCESTSPPKTGRVYGHIIPGAAPRPDTGTVQVSLFVAWDTTKGLAAEAPGGPPAFASEPIPQGSNEYSIENVTFGTYAAVAVSWRDTTLSGLAATTTIGAWGADPEHGDNVPESITLTESEPELELDIPVDYSRVKTATGPTGSISGTVTLAGSWPSAPVYLVVLPPNAIGPGPAFPPMGMPVAMAPLAQFSGSASYVIPNVPYGTYVVAAYTYMPPMTFGFVGAYGVDVAGGDLTPEEVTVGPSAIDVTGIDFVIRP